MKDYKSKISFVNLVGMAITSIMLLALIFLMFTTVDVTFKLDKHFWTTFGIGSFLMIMIIFTWLPSGKEKGYKNIKYINNKTQYDNKANAISKKQYNENLKTFCTEWNDKSKLEMIRYKLQKANLDFKDFEARKNTKPEVILKDQTLTKKQRRVIVRLLTKEVRHTEISQTKIVTGISSQKHISLNNKEKIYQYSYIVFKVLTSLLMMMFLASLLLEQGVATIAKIAQFFMWSIAIGTNIYSTINFGEKLIIVYRHEYYLNLNTICDEFDEWLVKHEFAPLVDNTPKIEEKKEQGE